MVAQTPIVHDLAISAVPYDAILVRDLIASLGARLERPPVVRTSEDVREGSSVVLVLHQRLWGHECVTAIDAAVDLPALARDNPASMLVVELDDEPLPEWMAPLRRCALPAEGVDGIVALALDAIRGAGGRVIEAPAAPAAAPRDAALSWTNAPTPFLGQLRAHSVLRHELEALTADLQTRCDAAGGSDGEHVAELYKLPHRVVARMDDVSVSFSWVPGRAGTVADGRLMVIEWRGMSQGRGMAALRAAQLTREAVYTAESADGGQWCWRTDAPHGRASSTGHLVAEWMQGASIPLRTITRGNA